ncbi:MAG: hypothetical protein E3J52_07365 [Promethearchaeota archaeon]|nr:hypothetical protein [Candidatus Lokiarchaeota archaeon]MCK4479032.1 hypothetical protein [Candidatus Lokiarchaeota archaeon]TET58887.1 MAG: hypothetical protein E3J52_07365 [Candidatus Lokiarchaeota archaeon]
MADLLRSGNTMLNMACPVCNNPIFRNNEGVNFCPTCNREILVINNKTNQEISTMKNKIQNNKQQKEFHQDRQNELVNLLEDVLFEKIEMITHKLRNESHLQLIENYTKILINCLDLLNKIPERK